MKLSRFLSILSLVTLFSILYVWQQTEIFRLSYINKHKLLAQELLDKNTILRYNIFRKASLVSVGNKIVREAAFQMPDTYRLVRLGSGARVLALKQKPENRETLLSRIFSIKREAQAKTVSSP